MLRRTVLTALGAAVAAPAIVRADDWPNKQIKVVIPYPPAGPTDICTRIVMEKAGQLLGQPMLFDNKGGASGMIGAAYAKTQPADGYNFLATTVAMLAITRHLQPIPFDPDKDFLTIARTATSWACFTIHPSVPANNMAEFVTYAKANADKMNYATSSATFQLVTELFKQKTGAPMQAIPYKSANEMVMAVVSGQVSATIADAGPVSPQVKAGTVRALAVTSKNRLSDFPDVPTMKESGADVDAIIWTGIFAPKGTPAEIVRKLEAEFMKIAKLPDVATRLKAIGVDAVGTSTEEFTNILKSDIARWRDVVKSSNIKIEN